MDALTTKNSQQQDIDWKEVVLGKEGEGIALIEHLAQRRFNHGPLSEEAVNYTLEQISKDNWQRCSTFKGNASSKTFANRLIANLLEEFSRKRFGRPRPPSWLDKQGEIWVKLWKELCLERQQLPVLLDRYTQDGLYDKQWVTTVATTIKARIPNCGQAIREAHTVEDIVQTSDQTATENTGQHLTTTDDTCGYDFELSAEAETLLMLRAITEENVSASLFKLEATKAAETNAQSEQLSLNKLSAALDLDNTEVIILRMIYSDGLSRAATAKALGLSPYQTTTIVNNALERIKVAVTDCGLDLTHLLEKI